MLWPFQGRALLPQRRWRSSAALPGIEHTRPQFFQNRLMAPHPILLPIQWREGVRRTGEGCLCRIEGQPVMKQSSRCAELLKKGNGAGSGSGLLCRTAPVSGAAPESVSERWNYTRVPLSSYPLRLRQPRSEKIGKVTHHPGPISVDASQFPASRSYSSPTAGWPTWKVRAVRHRKNGN